MGRAEHIDMEINIGKIYSLHMSVSGLMKMFFLIGIVH